MASQSWKDQAVRIAHEEFPGDQCYTSGDTYGYDGFDVCYNDWKEGYNRPNTTSNRDLSVNIMIMNLVVIIAPLA